MNFNGQDEDKNPYKGFIPSSLFMILIPIVCVLITYGIFYIAKYNSQENEYICIGLGVGFAINFSFLFCGIMNKPFALLCQRQKDFFENVTISPISAMKWHFQDFWKKGGIIFWTYLFILIGNFAIFVWMLLPYLDAIIQG